MIRVRFAPDDLLRARDLAADVGAEARHRERHLRAAHRTWGIALGLDVVLVKGRSAAVVAPGLAYDACGREFLVNRRQIVRAPVRPEGAIVDLVGEAGGCPPGLTWRDAPAPAGAGVILARATVADAALGALDFSVRRAARPIAGGRMGAGVAEIELPVAVWNQASVDTSAAGFATTPCYVVTLEEPSGTGLVALGTAWSRLIGPFLDVHDETSQGFELDVRLALSSRRRAARAAQRDSVTLRVVWMGVEPPERCADTEPREEWR